MVRDRLSPNVFILLLNYRGADDTLACLESLRHLNYPRYHIVVIDNASGDGSVEKLRAAQQQQDFHLIESPENLGFSGGNNLGIEYALANDADYLWLLNNDTTVDSNALTYLVEQSEKTGGLVGSLLLYPDRTYQQVGTRIKWLTGQTRGIPEHEISDGMEVDCLTGASMLIPAKLVRRIGMLDETYFLYFEDGEFCLRARKLNYPCTVALRSRVFHKEGASTGKRSLRTQYYYQRNRLKMLMHYASPMEKMTISGYTAFRLLRSIVKALVGPADRKDSAKIHWLAIFDYIRGAGGPCPHAI